LNGFGKLTGDVNAGKKEKSWQRKQPEKRQLLRKHKTVKEYLIKDGY
jgi:hypothetical protein